MRIALVVLTLSSLFFACTDSGNEAVVTLDQIGGNTDKYSVVDSVQLPEVQENEKPVSSFFLTTFDSLYPNTEWFKLDSMLFPDRFGPSKMEKWYLSSTEDSLVALVYSYKDSLKTRNAFFNWLDCYGPNCISYQVGSEFKKQKRSSLFLVSQTQLIYIESRKEIPLKKIVTLLNPKKKDQNWTYIVDIPARSKSRWLNMKTGELKPIPASVNTNEYGEF